MVLLGPEVEVNESLALRTMEFVLDRSGLLNARNLIMNEW